MQIAYCVIVMCLVITAKEAHFCDSCNISSAARNFVRGGPVTEVSATDIVLSPTVPAV